MTAPAVAPPPPLTRPIGPLARIARLALKELRETLRDRRMMATLVLMPLLVYPVLSLAFRQFLLSSFQRPSELRWIIATSTLEEGTRLMMLLQRGDRLLQDQGDFSAARASTQSGLVLGAGLGAADPPLGEIDFRVADDLDEVVRLRLVELGVRLIRRRDDPDVRREARFNFQLLYRPNTPTSRQAAEFVERRLRAVNESDVVARLQEKGDSGRMLSAWRLQPVADEEGHSFWLATLVPLVLILMTITGAVYPAIDLTAGERERGTLEALMAAPVPRLSLLIAKYLVVVGVAMLTAIINLTAMTVTITSAGLWGTFFGAAGLSAGAILSVLALLVLFAAFFSALLLAITSVARSFKEAQAYLIPLMLVSLAPGFLSVMPGLELNGLLSVTPLANIVLLTRDVLEGRASLLWGSVAVLTTVLYGALALTWAARIFGSDSILYGSQAAWTDLFQKPRTTRKQPAIADALACLALVAPMFIVASGLHGQMMAMDMLAQFAAGVGISLLLFVFVPLAMARWQAVELRSGFQLVSAPGLAWLGAAILGCALAPLVIELILISRWLGLTMISQERLVEYSHLIEAVITRWRAISPIIVLASLAIVPAVSEELFFRGYLLGALRGRVPGWLAIVLTAVVFGLFHASLGGVVMVDRVLPSTMLGIVLGWVCWQTRSVLPGMLLHMLNNGLIVSLAYWEPEVKRLGLDALGRSHVPATWLAGAAVLTAGGLALVYLGRKMDPAKVGFIHQEALANELKPER